jgi:hypothetical protein
MNLKKRWVWIVSFAMLSLPIQQQMGYASDDKPEKNIARK